MEQQSIMDRIRQNNQRAEELVKFIQNELTFLRTAAVQKYYQKKEVELRERQTQLKNELEYWQNKVIELEIMNNIPQYSVPSDIKKSDANVYINNTLNVDASKEISKEQNADIDTAKDIKPSKLGVPNIEKKAAKKGSKKEKEPKMGKEEKPAAEEQAINVSRLDFRIGRILSAKKHPDAESLYVEEIDVGENKPRTVVSGLVKYVPLEEMQDRLVVVLCNLKPAKMRGITSEAMVMCASTPEKVEILIPPVNSVPGDRVVCKDYPGDPDPLLPPKKKIFEQVAPDLKTNDNCIATYKASPLEVLSKGEIKAPTLTNVQIK